MEDPLLPGEFGLYSRTSTIHEAPSLMADLINRTLTLCTYPVHHTHISIYRYRYRYIDRDRDRWVELASVVNDAVKGGNDCVS